MTSISEEERMGVPCEGTWDKCTVVPMMLARMESKFADLRAEIAEGKKVVWANIWPGLIAAIAVGGVIYAATIGPIKDGDVKIERRIDRIELVVSGLASASERSIDWQTRREKDLDRLQALIERHITADQDIMRRMENSMVSHEDLADLKNDMHEHFKREGQSVPPDLPTRRNRKQQEPAQ